MTGRKLQRIAARSSCLRQGPGNRHALLREVAGLPVEQIRRRGYGSGSGDALDRRSDGRGGHALARPSPRRNFRRGRFCPPSGTVFFTVNDHDKAAAVELARRYVDLGFKIVATEGTANVLEKAGLSVERVFKVKEGRPNVVDLIKGDRIQLIVNTPRGQDTFFDEKAIRRAAVLARIPTITTIAAAQAAAEGIAAMQRHRTTVYALQELHTAIGV